MRYKSFAGLLAAVAVLGVALDSRAAAIRAASLVLSAPPVIGAFSFDRTIDQSGLLIGYTSGITDFDTYVALLPKHAGNTSPPNFAASFSLPQQDVDFDLGAAYDVQKLAFWNYPFSGSAGVTGVQVFTANSPSFSGAVFQGQFNPADDAVNNLNTVQVLDIADAFARYVRLRITATASSNGTGFSEVAFAVAVPEPIAITHVAVASVLLLGAFRRIRSLWPF